MKAQAQPPKVPGTVGPLKWHYRQFTQQQIFSAMSRDSELRAHQVSFRSQGGGSCKMVPGNKYCSNHGHGNDKEGAWKITNRGSTQACVALCEQTAGCNGGYYWGNGITFFMILYPLMQAPRSSNQLAHLKVVTNSYR